jgi:uncharacterized protein YecT (DUF1311 family)
MSLPFHRILRHAVFGGLLLAGATVFSPTVMAQDEATSDPCASLPDDHALRACRTRDLDEAAAELKEVVWELSQSLSEGLDGNAKALETAQVDWDRFMRSECKLINFESLSGTAGDIYEMDCLSTMTRARTKLLREMLDSP